MLKIKGPNGGPVIYGEDSPSKEGLIEVIWGELHQNLSSVKPKGGCFGMNGGWERRKCGEVKVFI